MSMWLLLVIVGFLSVVESQNTCNPTNLPLNNGVVGGVGRCTFTSTPGGATEMTFVIPNACTAQPYTIALQSLTTSMCFTPSILDAAGNVVPQAFPGLVIINSGLNTLVVRQPPPVCTQETLVLVFTQGTTVPCSGQITALVSMNMNSAVPTFSNVNTPVNINPQQYNFYQINGITAASGLPYIVSLIPSTPVITFFNFDNQAIYATQFNCNDNITPKFSVLPVTPGTSAISLGVFANAAMSTYSILSYQAVKTTLVQNVQSGTQQIGAGEHQWFTIPNPTTPNLAITLLGGATGLKVIFDMTQTNLFPSEFDSPSFAINPGQPMAFQSVSPVVAILNTNNAPVTYSVLVNTVIPTPIAPIPAQVFVPNQAVLSLSLGAIIGIIVGAIAFITLVIVSVCIYSKVRSRKAREYKQLAATAVAVKREPSSSSTESDSSSEEEDDNSDSYPPPRRNSRIYRSGGRSRKNSRNRSYSDDDSSDYS